MSSGANSPAQQSGPVKKTTEQVTFKFCPECSNMLYPKEDRDARKLMFTCRTCHTTEEATSNCVYRNVLKNTAGETAGVTQDVGSDPTVGVHPHLTLAACGCCGQIIMCSECGIHEAMFPKDDVSKTADNDTASTPSAYQSEFDSLDLIAENGASADTLEELLARQDESFAAYISMEMEDEDMEGWEPENDQSQAIDTPMGGLAISA